MKGFFFIIDKALIYTIKQRGCLVNERNKDYKCVHLPPYSPELNPIELFWALVKRKVRRNKALKSRIVSTPNKVIIRRFKNIN